MMKSIFFKLITQVNIIQFLQEPVKSQAHRTGSETVTCSDRRHTPPLRRERRKRFWTFQEKATSLPFDLHSRPGLRIYL